MERINRWRCFGGRQDVYAHDSSTLGCRMEFAVFAPPQAEQGPVPVLIYLSGLTCTWENAVTKAGAQRKAAELGIALVFPDTSPRGDDVPDSHDEYDFGKGAGFYLSATEAPWSSHYKMDSYVVDELQTLITETLPNGVTSTGITGHSMGGHGALTLALKNPQAFRSVSAFAPIVAPTQVPWGEKAFSRYLGDDRNAWAVYDATELVSTRGWQGDILIDQGTADTFLTSQLKPELFEAACAAKGVPLTLRRQEGYDHSYYFMASFIDDHIEWHAERLGA